MKETTRSSLKWQILFLACMVTFGGYYSFDFPSALHNPLRRHFHLEKNDFEFYFSLLYSLYSMPNMILPGLGGMLSDWVGNDKVMMGCATMVLLGNILLFLACLRRDLWTLEVGRFIFGLGAETLQVCANTIIAKWFDGQELALALGINLSVCKLGGVLTDWASPLLASWFGIEVAAGMVTLLCTACYGLTVYLVYKDSSTENASPSYSSSSYQVISDQDGESRVTQPHNYQTINDIDANDNNGLELGSVNGTKKENETAASITVTGSDLVSSSSVFGVSAWLLFVITFIMYGVYVPFNNISNAVLLEVFFEEVDGNDSLKQEQNELMAARLQSIPYFLSVLLTPFLGWAIDKYGFRTAQLVVSALVLACAHALIYYAELGPFYPLLLIGLSYSVFGSVSWACVPLIVAPSHHGTAYGIMCAFQNAGQSVMPLLLQNLIRSSGHFRDCEALLSFLALLSVVLSIVLYIVDYLIHANLLQVATV